MPRTIGGGSGLRKSTAKRKSKYEARKMRNRSPARRAWSHSGAEGGAGQYRGAVAVGNDVSSPNSRDDIHRGTGEVAEDLEGKVHAQIAGPLHRRQDTGIRLCSPPLMQTPQPKVDGLL